MARAYRNHAAEKRRKKRQGLAPGGKPAVAGTVSGFSVVGLEDVQKLGNLVHWDTEITAAKFEHTAALPDMLIRRGYRPAGSHSGV
jgi:hypothetical protein